MWVPKKYHLATIKLELWYVRMYKYVAVVRSIGTYSAIVPEQISYYYFWINCFIFVQFWLKPKAFFPCLSHRPEKWEWWINFPFCFFVGGEDGSFRTITDCCKETKTSFASVWSVRFFAHLSVHMHLYVLYIYILFDIYIYTHKFVKGIIWLM